MNKLRRSAKRASLLAFSMVATALLVVSPIATAATGTTSSSASAPSYVSQFGVWGSGEGEFFYPGGLTVDSNDNMYVADSVNGRIQVFTSNGTYVSHFGNPGSGDGQFSNPYDVAIASNGNIYVADTGNSRVVEFTSTGDYVTQFGNSAGEGQLINPFGLGIAGNDNIYVADADSNSIVEFTGDGTYVNRFGSVGSGDGQLSGPTDVAIASNGNVYVADSYNKRVQEFTSNGTYISQFGSVGSGDGQLAVPTNIFIASNGNIYVTDNHRVMEFTSDGTYVSQFGELGGGNGKFSYPYGIAIASNGNIYVTDQIDNRVQVFGYPQNLGTVASAIGSSQINLTLPETNNISSITSSAASATDTGYDYPLGLVDFTASVASGSTNLVTLTFQTDLKPSDVTARKYNSTTKQYAAIPSATITETTVSGQPVLQLTYSVTDGGPLDEDGTANGVIVDPVGLATTVSPSGSSPTIPTAPKTGYAVSNRTSSIIVALVGGAIVLIGTGTVLLYRSKRAIDRK